MKEPPFLIKYRLGGAPESVWTFQRGQISRALDGI